jgi:hypothetical protein
MNFQKKLDNVTKAPKVHAETIRLFQKIVYGKQSNSINEAIVQLKQVLSMLDYDIVTEIAGSLAYCSEVYRGQVFKLGINHTGAAESTHKMIKSSPRSPHFIGIREVCSRTHELKAAASLAEVVRHFQRTHFFRKVHGLELSRPILKRIDLYIVRSHGRSIKIMTAHMHIVRGTGRKGDDGSYLTTNITPGM